MKKTLRLLSVLTAVAILISLFACSKNKGGILNLSYFNTAVHIETHDFAMSENTVSLIKNTLSSIESRFEAEGESSLVTAFNSASADTVFDNLSQEEIDVLEKSQIAYELSGGYYNPTVYPLVKLWGFAPYKFTANFIPPTDTQIQDTLLLCDYSKVLLNVENKTLTKLDKSVKLDLGGVVKGYASDEIAKILIDNGHDSGYVNIGGSSLTLLSVPSLGIRHPIKTGESILQINVKDMTNLSISTSGDYERYHTDKNGIKYCHLINPFDGYPTKTGIRSATVIGIDGAVADALTTALCLYQYNSKELNDFITRIIGRSPDCMVFLIFDKDGEKEVLTNKKQGEDFTLQDTDYTVVNF